MQFTPRAADLIDPLQRQFNRFRGGGAEHGWNRLPSSSPSISASELRPARISAREALWSGVRSPRSPTRLGFVLQRRCEEVARHSVADRLVALVIDRAWRPFSARRDGKPGHRHIERIRAAMSTFGPSRATLGVVSGDAAGQAMRSKCCSADGGRKRVRLAITCRSPLRACPCV